MSSLYTISLTLGVIVFIAMSGFALFYWWRNVTGRALLAAALTTLAWSLAAIIPATQPAVAAFESLMLAAWLFLLWRALDIDGPSLGPARLIGIAAILLALANILHVFVALGLGLTESELMSRILMLVANVAGLVLIEQLAGNSRADMRWRIRYLNIGLAVLFGYGVVLHGMALALNRELAMLTILQPAVVAIAMPLLGVASLRNRTNKLKFNLSRDLVFRTGVLATTGGFLLALSLLGYLAQIFAGDVGLTISFFFSILLK